jgi:hypothetical protein
MPEGEAFNEPPRRGTRDSDDFDPGFVRRPGRRPASGGSSTAKILLLVFGGLTLLGCLVCGGLIGYGIYLMEPNWQTITSGDGEYTAKFPRKLPSIKTGNGPDGRPYTAQESSYGFPPSNFFIRVADVTPNEARTPKQLLESVADAWAKDGTRTQEEHRDANDHRGYPGLDLVLTRGSDKTIVLRFVLIGTKLYTIGVDSDIFDDSDDPVIEFLDGFEPKAPPTGKPK